MIVNYYNHALLLRGDLKFSHAYFSLRCVTLSFMPGADDP